MCVSTAWKWEVRPTSEKQQVRDCLTEGACIQIHRAGWTQASWKSRLMCLWGCLWCLWQLMVIGKEASKFTMTENNKCYARFLERQESGGPGELINPIPVCRKGTVHIILESVGLDDFQPTFLWFSCLQMEPWSLIFVSSCQLKLCFFLSPAVFS